MSNYRRVFNQNSFVFITVVTFKRNPLLIKNIEILRKSFIVSKKKFSYELFGLVVLPDHFHIIIKPKNIKDYPQIISLIKSNFSINIDEKQIKHYKKYLTESKLKKREKGVWQRRYYEHTIQEEKDLYNHLDYIHYNPVKHKYVKNVNDWRFSSFHKFVDKGYYNIYWGSDFTDNDINLKYD